MIKKKGAKKKQKQKCKQWKKTKQTAPHRRQAWFIISGAVDRMEQNVGVFQSLLQKIPQTGKEDSVDKDMDRTYANYPES